MVRMGDREYSRCGVARYVGHTRQLGGIRMSELADGPGRGARIADVDTGFLRFVVVVDRGMDITGAWACGVPLAWLSPGGDAHPHRFEPSGLGWLRTFPGGLVTTCGLAYAGAPSVDGDESLGLHGRISHSQASCVCARERWDGDDCVLELSGEVREWALFGNNLVMRRTISTRLGSASLAIEDEITNEGFAESPLMLLYHMNLGWPLVSPDTTVDIASEPVARDADAENGIEDWWRMDEPATGYREKVYYHSPKPGPDGWAQATVSNRAFRHPAFPGGISLQIRHRAVRDGQWGALDRLVQWKQMGEGAYILGIEPSNCLVGGRALARRDGTLRYIGPGETQRFRVEVTVPELG